MCPNRAYYTAESLGNTQRNQKARKPQLQFWLPWPAGLTPTPSNSVPGWNNELGKFLKIVWVNTMHTHIRDNNFISQLNN